MNKPTSDNEGKATFPITALLRYQQWRLNANHLTFLLTGSMYSNMDSSGNMFLEMPTSDDSVESPVPQRIDNCQDANTACPSNHINKLYSMQTSYFCAE